MTVSGKVSSVSSFSCRHIFILSTWRDAYFVLYLADYSATLTVWKTHSHMHNLRFQCGTKASVFKKIIQNLGQHLSFFFKFTGGQYWHNTPIIYPNLPWTWINLIVLCLNPLSLFYLALLASTGRRIPGRAVLCRRMGRKSQGGVHWGDTQRSLCNW